MIINYFRLKLNIYINRFKAKPKEDAYGELFGYFFIIALFTTIIYFVFSKIFDSNTETIFPIMFLNFTMLCIISISSTFKYLYNSIFEFSDKEILFILPCKNIDIILIKYLESMLNFWPLFLFFFMPTIIAFLLIDFKFIFSAILLIFSVNLMGICIISFLIVILFTAINISKGKNIKMTSVFLSGLFTAAVFIIIFFFSDKIDITQNKLLTNVLFMPFNSAYDIMVNYGDFLNNLIKLVLSLMYTFIIFLFTAVLFSKSIDKGTLLLDSSYITKAPIITVFLDSKVFNSFKILLNKLGFSQESLVIWNKDVKSLFSNFELLKLVSQVIFLFTIFNLRLKFSPNGFGYLTTLIIKTLTLVICLSYYLIRYESGSFYLILNSGLCTIDILKSKILTVLTILIPLISIFDVISSIIMKTQTIISIYMIFIDIFALILTSIFSIYYIFKYSNISMKSVEVDFKAGLFIFANLMISVFPIFLIGSFTIGLIEDMSFFNITKTMLLFAITFIIVLICSFKPFKTIKYSRDINHEIY